MYRYHIEVEYTDGSSFVFSISDIEGLFSELKFLVGDRHGSISNIYAERDYYDSPVGINNH